MCTAATAPLVPLRGRRYRRRIAFGSQMEIVFGDARTQKLFNEHDRLAALYGDGLAMKVASRMALLVVTGDLTMLPARPPIGVRGEGDGCFSLHLDASHRLRFVGEAGSAAPARRSPGRIRRIRVLGVDGPTAARRPQGPG